MITESHIANAIFLFSINQGTAAPPRNAYPGAPPGSIKGGQRPAMTSPAGGLTGAPYRGAGWTPQGYAPTQQAYRYTAPIHQPSYAAYTPHTTAVSDSAKIL